MAPSMSRQSQIVPYTTSFVCIVRWPAHIKFTRTRYDHAAMFGANATTHLNHTRHHHPPPRDDHSLGAKFWFKPLLSTVTPTLIIAPISKWWWYFLFIYLGLYHWYQQVLYILEYGMRDISPVHVNSNLWFTTVFACEVLCIWLRWQVYMAIFCSARHLY